jgi:hypothetical protein
MLLMGVLGSFLPGHVVQSAVCAEHEMPCGLVVRAAVASQKHSGLKHAW